ncbi:sarcosine oxidase subunit gamma [Mesobacterium pallidum]|uniref:sarcosine oxidase subunit gamma n=1 Tax=Mesobacterium pallidum TaxID=2872037 RepID=UPI001EE2175E|nr:sarcosine oxidase subunit gamma family protein [Mesobacterium pallidum]
MSAPISQKAPGVLAASTAAEIALAAPCARLSLRARGDLAPLNAALGLTLPTRIGQVVPAGERQVICLGPDEWMIHAPSDDTAAIASACADAYATLPHSLVDVSAREVTLTIKGAHAAELLTIGCARDIDGIPVGEGRRTFFDGQTVILWRDGDTAFRMDVWNSFSGHVFDLLKTGCAELAAEHA